MRLTKQHIKKIHQVVEGLLDEDAQIHLFGSRVDDDLKGGDVDIMITTASVVGRPAVMAARIATQIEKKLEGRQVDVLLSTPETHIEPIHIIAKQKGIQI